MLVKGFVLTKRQQDPTLLALAKIIDYLQAESFVLLREGPIREHSLLERTRNLNIGRVALLDASPSDEPFTLQMIDATPGNSLADALRVVDSLQSALPLKDPLVESDRWSQILNPRLNIKTSTKQLSIQLGPIRPDLWETYGHDSEICPATFLEVAWRAA